MINIESKPKKTVQHFDGSITLDKTYTYTVSKCINGEVKYIVEMHDELPEALTSAIIGGILNYCMTIGIGQVENK
jgi:hypothetical protein